ncbi:hypothetical protein [Alienimonas californiensis]|uniref:PAP2 superfamily protein n=1 Tax=Alienimonas californiensis TaxID=2527989 RepID=A0A517P7K9_9PLAN|nr:hypothetical protein [Alienimonas californiensis]QDT15364.1 hypothetical protein CA12_14490 [Alienimonas californiensis]
MLLAHRLFLAAVACLVAAAVVGATSWNAQGPLPGDVALTKGLQSLFGADPGWAAWLTSTAKPPLVWLTVLVGAALAWAKAGWRGAVAVPAVFLMTLLIDMGLRAAIYVPKPIVEFVPIASPSDSSGLPSTFGLVFGAAFGAALLFPRTMPKPQAVTAVVVAALLLIAGACCRIVLGGHWFSQMAASLLAAFGVTLLAGWVIWAWRPPVETLLAPGSAATGTPSSDEDLLEPS